MPLAGLTFALVGPGRVGCSLAHWLAARGARATAVAGRGPRGGAEGLARELGCPAVAAADLASAGAGLLLVAVPDPALAGVAERLGQRPQAAVALHTSGSQEASVLAPLAAGGSAIGSLHPLLAFDSVRRDPAVARGIVFGVDGGPAALALARRLAESLGARAVEIPSGRRTLYHFAATLAAGGVATLFAAVAELADRLRLPEGVLEGFRALGLGVLGRGSGGDPAAAITGPVARGDRETVMRQLGELEQVAPQLVPLAAVLALETLRQRRRVSPPDGEQEGLQAELRRLLATSKVHLDPR